MPASTARHRTARRVRRLRRSSVAALWRRSAAHPPGDRWAFRYETVARRLTRVLKKVERVVLPPASLRQDDVPSSAVSRDVRVEQPMLLIAQMGRSGGTLLMRLFDAHPQCWVVPHELSTLLPDHDLPLTAAAYDQLTPRSLYQWRKRGVRIGKGSLSGPREHVRAFEMSPSHARALFAERVESHPPHGERELLDDYFSAYFSAWANGPEPRDPRWLVGFEPGAIGDEARMRRFDANYPDGRVVSCVRDPWSWFVSARRWSLRFAHPDVALARWRRAAEQALSYRERSPERIHVILFDDLILRTRETMGGVAAFLGIDFDESLVVPTLGGEPADDNSSFAENANGVNDAPATKRRELLTEEETAVVEERAGDTWRRVLEAVGR